MRNKVEKIKALGKKTIIQLAYTIINSKKPPVNIIPHDFKISVWGNKKEIIVKFIRQIRYIPKESEEMNLYYDLSVNVISKLIDPIDFWGNDSFYQASKQDIKNIEFVKKHFGLPVQGFENTIHEEDEMFYIILDNEEAYGRYYIDKITGEEAIGSIQGSYLPKPLPERTSKNIKEDPLIEITE